MDPGVSRRAVLKRGVGLVGATGVATAAAAGQPSEDDVGPIQVLPEAAEGFALSPLAPMDVPTALSFGPGRGRGDLYVPVLDGVVRRLHLEWTDAGPVVTDRTVAADGFNQPL
jgi:hypothetical protein